MKLLSKITVFILSIIFLILAGVYFAFLNIIPKVLSSEDFRIKYSNLLTKKLGVPSVVCGAEVKTYPDFSFDVKIKNVFSLDDNGAKIAEIDNLGYHSNIFSLKKGNLNTDYIFADVQSIKKHLPKNEHKKNKTFNLSYYPVININKILIKLDNKSKIEADNIISKKIKHNVETELLAYITTPYTKKPIIIGKNGKIIYNKQISLKDFSVQLYDSKLYLSGNKDKISVRGKSLPVNELEGAFLYFYKLKNPGKKNFIENFDKFAGTLDVNLDYSKSGFEGECVTNNLSALFWTRKIAVVLPKTTFYFKNRVIDAKTSGTFGSEPVATDFHLTGLATKDLHMVGNVYSKFTNKIAAKYFPEVKIKGIADAKVRYLFNNGAVDVFYTLRIQKGSNILSDYGNLDNINTFRELTAHTYKNGEIIHLTSFDYNINGKNILNGKGEFEKEKGKYKPAELSLKTNGKIPISVIGSFLKNYITNGSFDADISYKVKNRILLGGINLYDISHSNFLFLKNTKIKVEKDKLKVAAGGTFFNSPITISMNADNNFKSGLMVHNIDIYLKKFVVRKGVMDEIPIKEFTAKNKIKESSPNYNITIENGQLKVDEIYHRQFEITNVAVQGNMKNNIVNFVMPSARYSGGLLSAKGIYNVKTHCSDMQAFASDIDSNLAATRFFKLKDQVQGTAYAEAHVITKNKLNDINADVVFGIDDGFLPKLGSTEFIISKSKNKNKSKKRKFKFTLSKISNIDFSKPNVFYSNLYGGFTIHNEMVNNVKIFSKSDTLSMFIEGNYNIDTENGNLYLWGKHNRTASKKIRILKIPINLIYKIVFRTEHTAEQYKDKIKQIPSINAKITDEVSTFRVYVSGDLNSDSKLKVELKDLRY